jgi:hypothetical protein
VPIGLDEPYRVFISEDPIGLAGGINKYVYVGNSPVNLADPEGLDPRKYPMLRCHVNPHNDPIENAYGGALLIGAAGTTVFPALTEPALALLYKYGDKIGGLLDYLKDDLLDTAQGKPGIEDLPFMLSDKMKENECPADKHRPHKCHGPY